MFRILASLFVVGLIMLGSGCNPCRRLRTPPPCPPGPAMLPPGALPPGSVPPPPTALPPGAVPPGKFALPPGAVLTPPPGAKIVTPPGTPPGSVIPPPEPPPGIKPISAIPPPGPPEKAEYRWTPADTRPVPKGPSRVLLFPPETGEAPPAEPRKPPLPRIETKSPTPSLPVGIARFAGLSDKVSTGLRPSLDEGLDWLATNGYRTVLHVRLSDELDGADRKQVEKRGMKYASLEVNPADLTKETVDAFIRQVKDAGSQPLFVYDRDGSLTGPLWYLWFRVGEELDEDVSRVRAGALGLRESGAMWEAARKLAP